jgi:hypothetical protein
MIAPTNIPLWFKACPVCSSLSSYNTSDTDKRWNRVSHGALKNYALILLPLLWEFDNHFVSVRIILAIGFALQLVTLDMPVFVPVECCASDQTACATSVEFNAGR